MILFNARLVAQDELDREKRRVDKALKAKDEAAAKVRQLESDPKATAEQKSEAQAAYLASLDALNRAKAGEPAREDTPDADTDETDDTADEVADETDETDDTADEVADDTAEAEPAAEPEAAPELEHDEPASPETAEEREEPAAGDASS